MGLSCLPGHRYFAAVGGDAPAFEAWPRKTEWYLHEYLLALWGCLIGEMFDLEVSALLSMQPLTSKLSNRLCRKNARRDNDGRSFLPVLLSILQVRT